jgi:hypothetical protein
VLYQLSYLAERSESSLPDRFTLPAIELSDFDAEARCSRGSR